MILKCKNAFGNFTPGQTVEVPDGAKYDPFYFGEAANGDGEAGQETVVPIKALADLPDEVKEHLPPHVVQALPDKSRK